MNILRVDSIIHYYKEKKILADIYLQCQTHDIIGLFGNNGVGKSTLLKIIFGTITPYNKCITINNKYYTTPYKNKLVSYLNQSNYIPRNLTVQKAISLFIAKDCYKEDIRQYDIINKIFNSKIYTLSFGEKRFLETLLLIYSDSFFILLDEPFNGIEPVLIEKLIEIIIEQSKYKGFIITDHNYKFVIDVCNKLVLLKSGSIINLQDENQLEDYGYIAKC